MYTRTIALPLWARIFVPSAFAQCAVLICVDGTVAVLTGGSCFWILTAGLASVTSLFMAYFAVEAVRTENIYQLAAYVASSIAFLVGFVPPLVGFEEGQFAQSHDALAEIIRVLLLVAVGVVCSLQTCAPADALCSHIAI